MSNKKLLFIEILLISSFTLIYLFSPGNEVVHSDWETDLTPPTCSITFNNQTTPTPRVIVSVNPTPITVQATADDGGNSATITSLKKGATSLATTPAPSASPLSYPWNANSETAASTGTDFTFNADARDNSENTNSCSSTFTLYPALSNHTCTVNDDNIISGDTVRYTANTTGGDPSSKSFAWSGITSPPTTSFVDVTYATTGSQSGVSVVATSRNASTSSATCPTVSVYETPTITCDADRARALTNQNVAFNSTPSGGDSSDYSYFWAADETILDDGTVINAGVGDTTTQNTTPKLFSTPGAYTAGVTLTSQGSSSTPQSTCSTTVYTAPSATCSPSAATVVTSSNPNVIWTATGTGGYNNIYNWSGSGVSGTGATTTATYSTTGTKTVNVSATSLGWTSTTNSCNVRVVPPAPANPTATCTAGASTNINFHWDTVSAANKYEFTLRDTTNGSPGTLVGTADEATTAISMSKTGTPGHAYSWQIKATDTTGAFDSAASSSTVVCPVVLDTSLDEITVTPTPTGPTPTGPTPTGTTSSPTGSSGYYQCNTTSYTYDVRLSWSGATGSAGQYWVDATPDSSFGRCFYHASVPTGTTSIDTGINLLRLFDSENTENTSYCSDLGMADVLTFGSGVNYKARITNGASTADLTIRKTCRPQTPAIITSTRGCMSSPTESRATYTLTWANPDAAPVTEVQLSTDNFATRQTIAVTYANTITLPTSGSTLTPDTPYSFRLKNTATENGGISQVSGGSSLPPCIPLSGRVYDSTNTDNTKNALSEVNITSCNSYILPSSPITTSSDGTYTIQDIPRNTNICLQPAAKAGFTGPTPASKTYTVSSTTCNSGACDFTYEPVAPFLSSVITPTCSTYGQLCSGGQLPWSGYTGTRGRFQVDFVQRAPGQDCQVAFTAAGSNYFKKDVTPPAGSPPYSITTNIPEDFTWANTTTKSAPLKCAKSYCARVFNGTYSYYPAFEPPACPAITPAWLQSKDGDVHSNK